MTLVTLSDNGTASVTHLWRVLDVLCSLLLFYLAGHCENLVRSHVGLLFKIGRVVEHAVNHFALELCLRYLRFCFGDRYELVILFVFALEYWLCQVVGVIVSLRTAIPRIVIGERCLVRHWLGFSLCILPISIGDIFGSYRQILHLRNLIGRPRRFNNASRHVGVIVGLNGCSQFVHWNSNLIIKIIKLKLNLLFGNIIN